MALDVRPLALPEVLELRPRRFYDERGFLSEVWNSAAMSDAGLHFDFVQDTVSRSTKRGILRGLHLQVAPGAQDKLVRVSRGAIFDVAVDVRRSSPTFGKWVGHVISEEEWNQVLIPKGFAHGFLTLQDDTEVHYKSTDFYRPDLERVIRFDDPDLGISWPMPPDQIRLSSKDRDAPRLSAVNTGP